MDNFYKTYYDEYFKLIFSEDIEKKFEEFKKLALKVKSKKSKLIFAGNGASASISSHGAVDFTKQAGVRSITFSDANMITAFSNDYGYDNWMVKALDLYSNPNDVLVLTSVSGESPSVVLAAQRAREAEIKVVTFSGRSPKNSLRGLGDINFWVDSNAYNIVECIHMMWITTVIDAVIGKSEYEVS
ncbi:MAG: SIS domain-containing protein [Gammaproteobacteria bacterium]